MMNYQTELIKKTLERSIDKLYPSREVIEKVLFDGKKLRIYLGVDPTGPHLHLGHLTNLLVLRRFQELGHEIIFLIGDFTAQIGDPTDKTAVRPMLTQAQVKENLKTFKKQASRIIKLAGPNAAKIKFNSKWLAKMKLEDVIELARHFTVQQMIQRDMFQDRLRADKPIGIHEFLYPLMQGYDSIALDIDMEIGGTDQTFNMLVGRDLLKIYKNKEKFVVTTKLLENPKTGKKLMNKSEGGLINLDDSPEDIFGKVMAIDDAAMFAIAEHATEMPLEGVKKIEKQVASGGNPRDAKLKIAFAVVETLYGSAPAHKAEKKFLQIFSKHEKPSDTPLLRISLSNLALIDLLVEIKAASSKSEARRLIEQEAVHINDEKKINPAEMINLSKEILLQVGKRHFFRIQSSP